MASSKRGQRKGSGSKGRALIQAAGRESLPHRTAGGTLRARRRLLPGPTGREASTSGESSSTSADPPGPAAAAVNQGRKASLGAPVPALVRGLSFPGQRKDVQKRGSRTPKGKAHEGQPEDADTSPADPPRAKGVAMSSSSRTASASPSSNARMGDPPAETGGTTHPAQEVEKAGVKEEPKTANTPGWFWSRRPRLSPPKCPRPCHLPGLPCGLWTTPSDFTWRGWPDPATAATGWPRWGTLFSWMSSNRGVQGDFPEPNRNKVGWRWPVGHKKLGDHPG